MKVLEIGCGDSPETADSVRLDIRPVLHVTYLQSAVDLSNLESASFDRVLAKDVIEHIGWRDVPRALREWLRVLRPAGELEVETPNAFELAMQILGVTDVDLPRWKGEPDWQRFSRTAFGHQDYPQNAHLSYFTVPWLTGLLADAGAVKVDTLWSNVCRFRLRAVAP